MILSVTSPCTALKFFVGDTGVGICEWTSTDPEGKLTWKDPAGTVLTGEVLNDDKIGLVADRMVIDCSGVGVGVGVGVGADLWMVIGMRAIGKFSWF
jgi:hypothetical protein